MYNQLYNKTFYWTISSNLKIHIFFKEEKNVGVRRRFSLSKHHLCLRVLLQKYLIYKDINVVQNLYVESNLELFTYYCHVCEIVGIHLLVWKC